MSYPAASLIVSNSLPSNRQGVGASMINAVINLSVSLGLGIAGTTESRVDASGDGSLASLLTGQRSAVWCGVGLAGLGVLVTVLFVRVKPVAKAGLEEGGGGGGGGVGEEDGVGGGKGVVVELGMGESQSSSVSSSPTAAAAVVPVLVTAPSVETPAALEPSQARERVELTAVETAV